MVSGGLTGDSIRLLTFWLKSMLNRGRLTAAGALGVVVVVVVAVAGVMGAWTMICCCWMGGGAGLLRG